MPPRKHVVGGQVFICDLGYTEGETPLVTPPAESPECEPHTPHPTGYIARSDWADLMMKTRRVRKCKGCGKYQIWEPKVNHSAPAGAVQEDGGS
jgi:hypothetical protein